MSLPSTLRQNKPAVLLTLSLLLLARTQLLSLPASWVLESKEQRRERRRLEALTPLTTPQLEKESGDLFIISPDGSTRTLLVPFRGRISKVRITPTQSTTFQSDAPYFPLLRKGQRLGVNSDFIRQLRALLRIIIPSATGKETFLLVLHTTFLVLRTFLSVLGAKLDGRIVRDLVSANGPGFVRGIGWWFILAIPSTYTNAMIHLLQSKLSLAFRTNLTRYSHDLYLAKDKRNFYNLSLGLIPGDEMAMKKERIVDVKELEGAVVGSSVSEGNGEAGGGGFGADQYLTTDIMSFSDSLSSLYGNTCKPILDIVLFTAQLSSSLGPLGTLGLFGNYIITAWILRLVTPAFGTLASTTARLEGTYRSSVARVGREAEEIAFYNGGSRELGILKEAYRGLMKHVEGIMRLRIGYTMIEDFVVKYMWSAAGYSLMSIPVFFLNSTSGEGQDQMAHRTENYISSRRLLMSLADAGGRLMHSYKDLAELSGFTSRVYALVSSLHQLNSQPSQEEQHKITFILDKVSFNNVPVVIPSSTSEKEKLIKPLTLQIGKGDHLFITGPNGSGKSSIARVLAQLWPIETGIVQRPIGNGEGGIFFLPQRVYLSLGSLRDQVIYPDAYAKMKANGRTDAELMKDVLSGGEKQRMQIARIFYHRPAFAFLDDSTAAVSSDVEGIMYQELKDADITLITISHRPSLAQFHNMRLRLSGDEGSWELETIGDEKERVGLDKEIEQIEESLKEVQAWKEELDEVKAELGQVRRQSKLDLTSQ